MCLSILIHPGWVSYPPKVITKWEERLEGRLHLPSCFIASAQDLEGEAARAGRKRRSFKRARVDEDQMTSFYHLLTEKQQQYLRKYIELWQEKYEEDPSSNPRCVFDLTQDPNERPRMSKPPQYKLPTVMTGSSRFWVPSLGRWLIAKELAAAMGWAAWGQLWRAVFFNFRIMSCPK